MSKRALIVTLVVFAFLLVGVMMFWPAPPPPRKPLPSPNGYDELVKAAALLGAEASGYRTNSPDELRWIVEKNAKALELARTALKLDSRVPDDYTPDYWQRRWEEVADMKKLAFAFAAESRVAALDGRHSEAIVNSLDAARLGANSMRGGFVVVRLIGLNCEKIGVQSAMPLVTHLGTNDGWLGLELLLAIESKREPFEDTIKAERECIRRADTIRERIEFLIEMRSFDPVRKAAKPAIPKIQATQKQTRELILALAARWHELEQGKRPSSIADLVPRYIPSAPVDAETGKPLALP